MKKQPYVVNMYNKGVFHCRGRRQQKDGLGCKGSFYSWLDVLHRPQIAWKGISKVHYSPEN